VQRLAEPVEQGFAYAIRRGTQAFRIGKTDDAAAQLAADDPDLVYLKYLI
jgi:hypothetical protein